MTRRQDAGSGFLSAMPARCRARRTPFSLAPISVAVTRGGCPARANQT
jgi:hypothetical protein